MAVRLEKGRFLSGLFFVLLISVLTHQAVASSVAIYTGYEHWYYREINPAGESLNRESGWINSYRLTAQWDFHEQQSLNVSWAQQQDSVTYAGQTQTGRSHRTHTQQQVQEVEVMWRYQFTPYVVGLGWQHVNWDRDILANANVQRLFESYYWQGPVMQVGTQFDFQQVKIKLHLSAAWFLEGDVKVDLREIGYGIPQIPLQDGTEITANIELQIPLSQYWYISLIHQQAWRHFPESESIVLTKGLRRIYINEPESSNHRQSLWGGIGLRF